MTTLSSIPTQFGDISVRESEDPYLLLYSLTGGTLSVPSPDQASYGTGIGLMVAALVFSSIFLVAMIVIVVLVRKIIKYIKIQTEYS